MSTLYDQLRRRILDGDLAPGTVLSQVKLAQLLGTGRTPLREALRMLEREGLVDAEYNRRVRVSELSMAELDEIYARRVVLEAMAVRTTIPRMSSGDKEKLHSLEREMAAFMPDPVSRLQEWEVPHREFHRLLISHAGRSVVYDIQVLQDHAERYRAVLGRGLPGSFGPGAEDHASLVASVMAGDVDTASRTLASHLARAALALLSQIDPTHDARALREALKLVVNNQPLGR
ncbi:GntR family transcriptional regulator [Streptomyces chartreusis]|uniref:GntR family transcriptional regulator n=1 Tax=Streptomyces chartreusis TaxID=1969 RepID=UPI0036C29C4E